MMTSKKAFGILQINAGASIDQIKQSYRRLAFTLHPDLNPTLKDASKSFQQLNEAYVFLLNLYQNTNQKRSGKTTEQDKKADSKAYEDAQKAYEKASQQQNKDKKGSTQGQEKNSKESDNYKNYRRKEDVLNDILSDPFAKRVFEDIYRHIQSEQSKSKPKPKNKKQAQKAEKTSYSFCHKRESLSQDKKERKGILAKIKAWLRKQIDDEQTLNLPSSAVVPGARLRLDIQHGLGSDVQTIEIVLPPDYTPDKKVRLQGLGKRLGSLRGDLYVRIQAQ